MKVVKSATGADGAWVTHNIRTDHVFARARYYFENFDFLTGFYSFIYIMTGEAAVGPIAYLTIRHDGSEPRWLLWYIDGAGFVSGTDAGTSIPTGQWIEVEYEWKKAGGESRVWINGVLKLEVTGKDFNTYGLMRKIDIGSNERWGN